MSDAAAPEHAEAELKAWRDDLDDEIAKAFAAHNASGIRMSSLGLKRTGLDRLVLFVRTGWRPAAGWVSAMILLINGVVIPLDRLWDRTIPPVDWRAMTPFVVVLLGQAALRTWEKIKGADQ